MKKHVIAVSVTALSGVLLLSGGAIAVMNSGGDSPISTTTSETDPAAPTPTETGPTGTQDFEASATTSTSPSADPSRQATEVEIIPAQNGGEYYGTPVPFDPNKPRYDLQHGGNPYATYDQSQSDATPKTWLVDSPSNEQTTNPSQITATYPGQ